MSAVKSPTKGGGSEGERERELRYYVSRVDPIGTKIYIYIHILYEYNDIYRDIVRGVEHGSATTIDLRRNNSPVLGQDLIIRFFPYYSLSSRELDLWLSR